MTNLATLPAPDRIDTELARVQCNLLILTTMRGYTQERIEAFVFRIAARDLELAENLEPAAAAAALEARVVRAKNRTYALLNECSFEAIRALDARLTQQVAAGLEAKADAPVSTAP